MDIKQINFIENSPGVVELLEGPSRRAVRATTRSVALAMLGAEVPEEQTSDSDNILWTDYLATHGLAVGTRGKRQWILGVVPPKERTVNYTGPLDQTTASRSLVCQFPAMLLGIMREGVGTRVFKNGVVFCLNNPVTTNLGVTVSANVACSFPYGNVYQGTGKICWGSVPHTHIQTVKDLEELFFGSDFNGDLYYSGGGRLMTLARANKGKPLPVPAAAINIPGIIRCLSSAA